MSKESVTSKTESNRDKALRGEVVLVTKGRLREMQLQASALEGVGEGAYHWHWSAVLNELIARRSGALPAHGTTADCPDCMKCLEQEERATAYADQLTAMIGVLVGQDMGEHSSENEPWENAIEALRVAIGSKQSSVEPSATPSAGPSGNTRTVDTSAGCKPAGGVAVKATASLPACECLVRDKSPSAYHNVKCPRYVADLL
jgi:hypothetical protein